MERPTCPGGAVMLSWCHPGMVHGLFMQSIIGALQVLGDRCVGTINSEVGPLLAQGRNNIVRSFLTWHEDHPDRPIPQYLGMFDSDMVFDRDTIEKTMAILDGADTPILGGLCFGGGRGGAMFPTLYAVTDEKLNLDRVNEYPLDTLCKVDATGAAYLFIHRRVLEEMHHAFGLVHEDDGTVAVDEDGRVRETPYPWFTYGANDSKPVGEDIAFCLRARALDIPIHVHTGLRVGHIKSQILDEDMYLALRAEAQAAAVAPVRAKSAAGSLVNLKRLSA